MYYLLLIGPLDGRSQVDFDESFKELSEEVRELPNLKFKFLLKTDNEELPRLIQFVVVDLMEDSFDRGEVSFEANSSPGDTVRAFGDILKRRLSKRGTPG